MLQDHELQEKVRHADYLPALSGLRFSHVISIGSNCYPSAVFKKLGLKLYSGPFDWMFTTVPMVQACIESDFEQFLDRRYYRPVIREGKTEYKHTFYNTHWAANFTHYDPLSDGGHDYLTRCVERFRRVLAATGPKLFFFVAQIHAHERDRYVGEFENLTSAINARAGDATVVGVTVTKLDGKPVIAEAAKFGSSRLFHYSASSTLTGIVFQAEADNACIEHFVSDLTGAGM